MRMSKAEILEKYPLTMSELKTELAAITKRDGELGFRASKANEYVTGFSTLSKTANNDLRKQIQELNVLRMKEDHVAKIIDLMPVNANDLNQVLAGFGLSVSKDQQAKLLKLLDEHRK